MLVVERIVERDAAAGSGLDGIVLLDEDDGGFMWTFQGRQVVEAIRLADHRTVPLSVRHLDKLYQLHLIDDLALRRLICIAVR